jgi:transcriptional regulator with XRE-family HTH domain
MKKNRNIVLMIKTPDKEGLLKLGAHIKYLRSQRKMSQEQLAYASNISLSQISRIELGKHNTTFSTIISLCVALDLDMTDFFEGFDYPARKQEKRQKSQISTFR